MLPAAKAALFVLLWAVSCTWAQFDNFYTNFENDAIVRTVELGGAFVYVTRTYAVKALANGVSKYTVALSPSEHETTSWIQAKVKGETEVLPVEAETFGSSSFSQVHRYVVALPKRLNEGDTINLVVETVQTHAAQPWPASASQTEGQTLRYACDLFVISPYSTKVQRTKLRGAGPISSYDIPHDVGEFTFEDPVTKSGSTLTYGPFNNVPASAVAEFQEEKQQRVSVRYEYNEPVLTIKTLRRSAEISHWGSNLNIQDDIALRNDGPTLKGQFSRIDFQKAKYTQNVSPQIVESVKLLLPPGIHSPYFYDLNGNVSTSRFRPSKPPVTKTKSKSVQYSLLEFRPRYPLLGGWNYTFTLGWNAPLSDSATYDAKTGTYIVAIPFWTPLPYAVADDVETTVILPEGATDVEIQPPFPPLAMFKDTHITYLDTVGRPKVTFVAKNITDRHAGSIYVSYKVPVLMHLRKPLAIAAGTFGLFVLNFVTKRLDTRIHK